MEQLNKQQQIDGLFEGKYCIIRSGDMGVFLAKIDILAGNIALCSDVIRLWHWAGAATVSELAKHGVKTPSNCKFVKVLGQLRINTQESSIEFATDKAIESIKGVKEWTVWG